MAKKKIKREAGFSKPIRHRGEDIGQSASSYRYDYQTENQYSDRSQERFIDRREIRGVHDEMYRDEQRRDERAFARLRDINGEFYGGLDPRRRQEVADGGMIREDHTQIANLPRQFVNHEYPKSPYYDTPYIADSLRGTSDESDDNGYNMGRYLNPNNPYDK